MTYRNNDFNTITSLGELTSIEDFIKELNQVRLRNKDKWVFVSVSIGEKNISMKLYNLFLQVFRINNTNYGRGAEFKTVREWKDYIYNCIGDGN